MAEEKTKTPEKKEESKIERTYVIPLKRAYLKGRRYDRTRLAIREIKRFLAKHMKIADRDLSKIKLEPYFNNHLWSRGKYNPPSKVKVKAIKTEDAVKVDFLEVPQSVVFTKKKNEKRHKEEETPKKADKPEEEPGEEQSEEEKKEEGEKQKSAADAKEKQEEQKAKEEKHLLKVSKDKSATKQRKVLSRH